MFFLIGRPTDCLLFIAHRPVMLQVQAYWGKIPVWHLRIKFNCLHSSLASLNRYFPQGFYKDCGCQWEDYCSSGFLTAQDLQVLWLGHGLSWNIDFNLSVCGVEIHSFTHSNSQSWNKHFLNAYRVLGILLGLGPSLCQVFHYLLSDTE